MGDMILYIVLLALLALACVAAYWVLGNYLGQSPMVALFGERPEKRLAVIEHASVDGRRKLLLVRRDNVEHLLLTGGPVDVVIETGIGAERASEPVAQADGFDRIGSPVAARPARIFGRQQRPVADQRGASE